MKNAIFTATLAAAAVFAPVAVADEPASIVVEIPLDITDEDVAEATREKLLEAAETVCEIETRHDRYAFGTRQSNFRDCVKMSYENALSQDETGILTADDA